jgi:hypothetical protein
MATKDEIPAVTPGKDIRIIGINTDKTRRISDSETVYHVYFELSESPSVLWRSAFEKEWSALNTGQQLAKIDAGIDGAILIIQCKLDDIAGYLSLLKKAVAATNRAFEILVTNQNAVDKNREDLWKNERSTVERYAKLLRFD